MWFNNNCSNTFDDMSLCPSVLLIFLLLMGNIVRTREVPLLHSLLVMLTMATFTCQAIYFQCKSDNMLPSMLCYMLVKRPKTLMLHETCMLHECRKRLQHSFNMYVALRSYCLLDACNMHVTCALFRIGWR